MAARCVRYSIRFFIPRTGAGIGYLQHAVYDRAYQIGAATAAGFACRGVRIAWKNKMANLYPCIAAQYKTIAVNRHGTYVCAYARRVRGSADDRREYPGGYAGSVDRCIRFG